MHSVTAPATSPADDIDAVLGRFHAWSSAHKEAGKAKDFTDGVREVPYEEALQSSRRRWQFHEPTPPRSPQKERPTGGTDLRDEMIAPDKVTLSRATEPGGGDPADLETHRSASFGTVLSETVSPDVSSGPLALVWPAAAKAERQVSMSFRVAASEQALIKARAAEAGISVSAYLRQCALEVEKLRSQVHHTLSLIEERQMSFRSPSASQIAATSGSFFARLRQRIFRAPASLTLRT